MSDVTRILESRAKEGQHRLHRARQNWLVSFFGEGCSTAGRQLTHARFGAFESFAQFHQVGKHRCSEGTFDLSRRDLIMADEESDIRQVLRIIAPHHFRQDQVERGRAKEPEPACRRAGESKEMLFPIVPEEQLISH